ncbi:MAG: hypothetical protein OEV62_12175 [Actinomycetota bacterium]|nr:hypothetical protein [Actinomycetota bacterium]MDH4353550.1 hypothetical protein [Actinomycetota bacterium]
MTTTLERSGARLPERGNTLVLEPVALKDMPPLKTTAPTPKEGSRLPKYVAVGLLSALAGVAAGVGLGTWMSSDEIAGLEAQQGLMLTVPYGGFQSAYSAAREHQAFMDTPIVRTWPVPVSPPGAAADHEHQAFASEPGALAGDYAHEHQALVNEG